MKPADAKTLLLINNYHYRRGGADAVYLEHDTLFKAAGWNTASFSMKHPKNIPSEFEKYFVNEIEFGQNYGVLDKLRMASKIIYSREAKENMARLIDDVSPDVAHIHNVHHHISPSVLPVLHDHGIPVVLTAHDLKLLCPAYTMLSNGSICERCGNGAVWNTVTRKCIKGSTALSTLIALESGIHRMLKIYRNNVSKVVTPSRFYLQKFEQYGWPSEQMAYVPNYVRVDDFTPRFEPGDYFVYIGRLSYEKGMATLFDAAAAAGVKLVVVGDGPLRESLSKKAEDTDAQIEFAGFQSGDKLFDLIKNSRAMVLPSEWYENAPISLLEAYACGKPVIGADIGGIPECIAVDETGWLFESGSVEGLSDVLRRVQEMPDATVLSAGKAARARVEERHTPEHYLNSMRDLYAHLGQ